MFSCGGQFIRVDTLGIPGTFPHPQFEKYVQASASSHIQCFRYGVVLFPVFRHDGVLTRVLRMPRPLGRTHPGGPEIKQPAQSPTQMQSASHTQPIARLHACPGF